MSLSTNPATKNWDASLLNMIFMGVNVQTGFADGEFLKIARVAKSFDYKVGTDGEVVRFRTNNRVAIVTLKLFQTSDANSVLGALSELDLNTQGGAGIGPILVQDLGGSSIFAATNGWISKPPDRTFDREPTVREWEITMVLDEEVDGNN